MFGEIVAHSMTCTLKGRKAHIGYVVHDGVVH